MEDFYLTKETVEVSEYKGFRIRKITTRSELVGTDVFYHAEYKWDSEWHNEYLLPTYESVRDWIDEQHESEDFQEWEKEWIRNQMVSKR